MDKLAAVREKFLLSLPEKAKELEAAVNVANSEESLGSLRALVHKIAGSAGFYGYAALAELATAIDGQLKRPNDGVLSEQLHKDIGELLALLRRT